MYRAGEGYDGDFTSSLKVDLKVSEFFTVHNFVERLAECHEVIKCSHFDKTKYFVCYCIHLCIYVYILYLYFQFLVFYTKQ